MKDFELRTIMLQKFYDHRIGNRPLSFTGADLGPISADDYERIGRQLNEHRLLNWTGSLTPGQSYGTITARGVDVVEGTAQSPISVTFNDSSIKVHNSSNIQIGNSNTIGDSTCIARMNEAIDNASASEGEKTEAKTLVARLTNNATFGSIVGALVSLYATATN